MLWVLQGGPNDKYVRELTEAVEAEGGRVRMLELPYFATELPEPPDEPFMFYGATTATALAATTPGWQRGVAFVEWYSRWSEQVRLTWGMENMLSRNPVYTTIREADTIPWDRFFVRPDADLKEFAGQVMTKSELIDWGKRLGTVGFTGMVPNPETRIVAAPVIEEIAREWRIFIVNGKPVSCSRYRAYGISSIVREFPDELRDFILPILGRRPLGYKVFALDVGYDAQAERFGVIEANCFNSSGWYDCDMRAVVREIQEMA